MSCLAQPAQTEEPSTWLPLFALRGAAGYRDNVLFSDINQQESAFVASGVEVYLARTLDNGQALDFFASFDDQHYLEDVDVDREQVGFAQLHLAHDLDTRTTADLELQYVYQDQVLDVSVTEADLTILQVVGHTWLTTPTLLWEATPDVWQFEAGLPVERQWFLSPLDDYLEFGPRLALAHLYRHGSSCRLEYQFSNRGYDQDEQLTQEGLPIPGSHRAFRRAEIGLRWEHFWDAAHRWRSTTRLSHLRNRDNGSGYFDFNRIRIHHELRYRHRGWDLRAAFVYAHYHYDIQTVSSTDPELRLREDYRITLRVERSLNRWLSLFLDLEHEQSDSNIEVENYTINTTRLGLLAEF